MSNAGVVGSQDSRMRRRSVENVRGISREINLPATFGKPPPARLPSFEVEQNPAPRGPHERRRAGLLVFYGDLRVEQATGPFREFTIELRYPPPP
jgi:hypothetical protein